MGMTNREEAAKLDWPRWQQVLLIALLAVLIVNRMTILLDAAAARAGIAGEMPRVGASIRPDPDKPGYVRVAEVAPDGPAASAGVKVGDYLTSERS
jgi:S1-C subfamily serine protease